MYILSKDIINHENEEIELRGWIDVRRDHGKLIFIDLRDREGITQIIFSPDDSNLISEAGRLRSEWVVSICGVVKKRPENMKNPNILNGSYEVSATKLKIISESKTPPIEVTNDGKEIGEDIRMKYRYLDLRRSRMQRNMRMRSKINLFIRNFFTNENFVEIETPILGKSTPEGARDYLVPSRLQEGMFYALPQSPQQYKQLLMVSGMERYFQIARCFRDEDTRGDRQPEFTQLDIEMSFTNEAEILNITEKLFTDIVKKFYPNKRIKEMPFPRIEYSDAIKKYNSDKPDLRENKDNPDELAFAFVVNFPMFEWKEKEKRWDATHHPFTMPDVKNAEDFWKKFKDDPSKIFARQYDVVLNGYEIGGGSIRIHDPELLSAIFEAMGNNVEDIKDKFGHILEAFKYGVPPHGGVALGLDRIFAILFNEPNIREVIAFPKTGDGRDLLMGAPSYVSKEQLKELHIKIDKK